MDQLRLLWMGVVMGFLETAFLKLKKPTFGSTPTASQKPWGAEMNENLDKIDAAIQDATAHESTKDVVFDADHGATDFGKLGLFQRVTFSAPGRLRVYVSEAARVADLARPISVDVTPGTGCLLEVKPNAEDGLGGSLTPLFTAAPEKGGDGLCYWTWDGDLGTTANFEYFNGSVEGERITPKDGATVHCEAVDPTVTDGVSGDTWINSDTWDFFQKVSGSWVWRGNLKGQPGTNGLSFVWRGAWDLATVYAANDAVSRNGSSFIALQSSTGQDPATATTYWGVLAARGSDGTNLASGIAANSITVSPVDMLKATAADSSGNYTDGIEFVPTTGLNVSGVRYFGFSGRTYKLSLWNSAGTRLATVTVVHGATGVGTGAFSAPVSLAPYTKYSVSLWTGTNESKAPSASQIITTPFLMGPCVVANAINKYGSGDVCPTLDSGSGRHPVEPIFA